MTNVVINLNETRRRRSSALPQISDTLVSRAETLELVRAYASIKDPEARRIALDHLKSFSESQN